MTSNAGSRKTEEQRDSGAAHDRAASRRPNGLRRSPGVDARPAAPGASVGPDARHLVHDQQGAERPPVPANRRPRGASSAIASRRYPGADRADVEDQPLSFGALLAVPGEAPRNARRRRFAAGPHDDPVWLGHLQQQQAFGRQPAAPARRRRGGDAQRRPASRLYRQPDDGQPAGHADGQARRAGRENRRQYWQAAYRHALLGSKMRLRPCRAEDMEIRGEASA